MKNKVVDHLRCIWMYYPEVVYEKDNPKCNKTTFYDCIPVPIQEHFISASLKGYSGRLKQLSHVGSTVSIGLGDGKYDTLLL